MTPTLSPHVVFHFVGIDVLTYFPAQAGSMQRTLIGKTDEV